jgi:hypothetical protein
MVSCIWPLGQGLRVLGTANVGRSEAERIFLRAPTTIWLAI